MRVTTLTLISNSRTPSRLRDRPAVGYPTISLEIVAALTL